MSRRSLRTPTRKFNNNTTKKLRHSSNRIFDTLNDQAFQSIDLEVYIKNTHRKLNAIESACKIAKQSVFAADLAVIHAENAIKTAITIQDANKITQNASYASKISSMYAHVAYADLQLQIHSEQINELQQNNITKQLPLPLPSPSITSISIPSTRDDLVECEHSPKLLSDDTSKLLEDFIEKTVYKLKKQKSINKLKKQKSIQEPIITPPIKDLPITDRSYENRRGSYNIDSFHTENNKKNKKCSSCFNCRCCSKSAKIYDKSNNKQSNNCNYLNVTNKLIDIIVKIIECINSTNISDDSDYDSSSSEYDSDSGSDSGSDSHSD